MNELVDTKDKYVVSLREKGSNIMVDFYIVFTPKGIIVYPYLDCTSNPQHFNELGNDNKILIIKHFMKGSL